MDSDKPKLVKVLVIGEAQVGKTKLIQRFSNDTFTDPSICPINSDIVLSTQSIVRLWAADQSLKLLIWDTAGVERYRGLTYPFYRGSKGVLLVYDITNRISFEKATIWADSLRWWVTDAAAVLVRTKVDLATSREVSYSEGVQLAERLRVPFLETSAKIATNVDQAFFTLLQIIGLNMGFTGRIGFKRNHEIPI